MEIFAEKFGDIKILRYEIPGFEELSLHKKLYLYYLSKATQAGRDILWDQHGKYNLLLRNVLEAIYKENKNNKSEEFKYFTEYLKKVWFAGGPHHHYSTRKFIPEFSKENFKLWCDKLNEHSFSTKQLELVERIIFDNDFLSIRVNTNPKDDIIVTSANNFYDNITEKEVIDYYDKMKNNSNNKKLSFGINSQLIKQNDKIKEKTYKINGKYSDSLELICLNLEHAKLYVENEKQTELLNYLIDFYRTGDLQTYDDFFIKWVDEQEGEIDFINGFIETYGDPLGIKATWEGVVELTDKVETKKAKTIADNANWFEDNAPVDKKFKKGEIKGVTAKAVNVVMLGGDCYPASPLGINLPNAEWIRETYGSKSVTLINIANAHHKDSQNSGFLEEFAFSTEEIELERKYATEADNLHTHLHECIGHGSGKLMPGVSGTDLKNYASVIEETRADLYGLYFMSDKKMLDLNLLSSLDAAKAHYNRYIRNGLLTQITRIKLGDNIEQAHMRNRQLIAKWAYELGKGEVITQHIKNGNFFYSVNDYEKLRNIFGQQLAEIQRIKSEGDFEKAKYLIETYGVKIDKEIHTNVLSRFKKLDIPPFTGFLNPNMKLKIVDNEIVDVSIDYDTDYLTQMMSK